MTNYECRRSASASLIRHLKVARRLGAAPSGWVLETRRRKLARGVFWNLLSDT